MPEAIKATSGEFLEIPRSKKLHIYPRILDTIVW